jgi:hypothetical protein
MKFVLLLLAFTASSNAQIFDDPLIQDWFNEQNQANLEAEETYVTIKNGTIVGTSYADVVNNKTIYAYLGIPYAKPPVGQLRFKVRSRIYNTLLSQLNNFGIRRKLYSLPSNMMDGMEFLMERCNLQLVPSFWQMSLLHRRTAFLSRFTPEGYAVLFG